jgi:hypothetical protein
VKKLVGKSDIEDALRRLDKLTLEESRMAAAQGLRATHGVDERVMSLGDEVRVANIKLDDVFDGAHLHFFWLPRSRLNF